MFLTAEIQVVPVLLWGGNYLEVIGAIIRIIRNIGKILLGSAVKSTSIVSVYLFSSIFAILPYVVIPIIFYIITYLASYFVRVFFEVFILDVWLIIHGFIRVVLVHWVRYLNSIFFERYNEYLKGWYNKQKELLELRFKLWGIRFRFWTFLRVGGLVVWFLWIFCSWWSGNWNFLYLNWGYLDIYLLESVDIFIWTYLEELANSQSLECYYSNMDLRSRYLLVYMNIFLNCLNIFWNWRPRTGFRWFVLYIKILYRGRDLFNWRISLWMWCNIRFYTWIFFCEYLNMPFAIAESVALKLLDYRWQMYQMNPWDFIWERFEESLETFLQQNQLFWEWYWVYKLRYDYMKIFGKRMGLWVYKIKGFHFIHCWHGYRIHYFRYLLVCFWARFYWGLIRYLWVIESFLGELGKKYGEWEVMWWEEEWFD